MNTFRFFVLIGLTSLFLATHARGETPYQYIAGAGQIGFGGGGAAAIPNPVLGAVAGGQISPIMQFILTNNMMTRKEGVRALTRMILSANERCSRRVNGHENKHLRPHVQQESGGARSAAVPARVAV